MRDGNDPPVGRQENGEPTSPDPVAPGDIDLPWKATAERRDLWGPVERPLEGTVHAPGSGTVGRPRRRSRLLTFGVPLLTGGLVGVACLVIGLGGAIAGPLGALGIAIGAGVIAAGGSGLAVRALRPALSPTAASGSPAEISASTGAMLESVLQATAASRARVAELRPRASDPAIGLVLEDVEGLLRRMDALATSETLQARRSYDGEVTMLEGMATRYLPELLDAAEETIGFLATFAGEARQDALENLTRIDQQLAVLGEGLERIERDIVSGVSRSLEVHAEFLRTRFADQHLDPIIDV